MGNYANVNSEVPSAVQIAWKIRCRGIYPRATVAHLSARSATMIVYVVPLIRFQVTALHGVLRSAVAGAGLLAPSVLLRKQSNYGLLIMVLG